MKCNFKNILVEFKFDEFEELDIAKDLGNYIHSNTIDIGLDDVARAIYHSDGDIEISNEHAAMISSIILKKDCPYLVAVKKAILKQLKTE